MPGKPIMKVPGASVVNDHQLAALLHVAMQRADNRIVRLTMHLVRNNQARGPHLEHGVKQRRVMHGLKMETLLLRRVDPNLNLQVFLIGGIGKQQQDGVGGRRRPMLVAIDNGGRAREQD